MERPAPAPLVAAMLLALALPATAGPQSYAAESTPAPDEETIPDAQDYDSPETSATAEDDTPQEGLSNAQAVDEDGTVAAEPEASGSGQLKEELKRMFVGLLLPAVERRVRKAVDGDDDKADQDDP